MMTSVDSLIGYSRERQRQRLAALKTSSVIAKNAFRNISDGNNSYNCNNNNYNSNDVMEVGNNGAVRGNWVNYIVRDKEQPKVGKI